MADKQNQYKMNNSLFSLSGKNIVVTGSSGLMGYQHVEAIIEAGGTPILIDINKIRVKEQVSYLKKKYKKGFIGYSVDITDEEQVQKCYKICIKKFHSIHGLINNAANNPKVEDNTSKNFSRVENFSIEIWDKDLAVSLKGSLLCIKYFGTEISKNKTGGTIINISSDLGVIAPDQRLYRKEELKEDAQPVKPITYSVVKAGLIGMTKYVATYWADKNVTCNAICPGGIENGQDAVFLKKIAKLIPLGRLAKKDEYRGLIIFLLSDAASYLNGSVIVADGGRSAW